MPAPAEHLLLCHPAKPATAACTVSASASFASDGSLILGYRLDGRTILRPARQASAPADDLWQHTCCEAFIAAVNATEYREFNFSPSGLWAVYRFTDYRVRDTDFQPTAAPQISLDDTPDGFSLIARLPASLLPAGARLQLALSCVIEQHDQTKTWWALAHRAAQPDFHLRTSFTLPLKVPQP